MPVAGVVVVGSLLVDLILHLVLAYDDVHALVGLMYLLQKCVCVY